MKREPFVRARKNFFCGISRDARAGAVCLRVFRRRACPSCRGGHFLSLRGGVKQRLAKRHLWNPLGERFPTAQTKVIRKAFLSKCPLSEFYQEISLAVPSVGGHFQSALVGSRFFVRLRRVFSLALACLSYQSRHLISRKGGIRQRPTKGNFGPFPPWPPLQTTKGGVLTNRCFFSQERGPP